jgi:serine/threonine protein kinase
MNRSFDYRTDFYSLGVTFYELLTGQLPFESTDALELVHCHIAKQPIPPHLLGGGEGERGRGGEPCPKAVSDIVMKLMAKTPEERYQSAWGIKADLEECLAPTTDHSGNISDFLPRLVKIFLTSFKSPKNFMDARLKLKHFTCSI